MPIKTIEYVMHYNQLRAISEAGLVPILRQKGMDVVFKQGSGVIAEVGSQFWWIDIGPCERKFTWKGTVPETPEELEIRRQEEAASNFLAAQNYRPLPIQQDQSSTEFNYEHEKTKVDDLFAPRAIRLED